MIDITVFIVISIEQFKNEKRSSNKERNYDILTTQHIDMLLYR